MKSKERSKQRSEKRKTMRMTMLATAMKEWEKKYATIGTDGKKIHPLDWIKYLDPTWSATECANDAWLKNPGWMRLMHMSIVHPNHLQQLPNQGHKS